MDSGVQVQDKYRDLLKSIRIVLTQKTNKGRPSPGSSTTPSTMQ
jgi:hypothetical protein